MTKRKRPPPTTTVTTRSHKHKHPSSSTTTIGTDFLSKLQTLRSFLGNENHNSYTESDLSQCLRECGYNVHLAGERLVTGRFRGGGGSGGGGGLTVSGGGRRKRGRMSSFFAVTGAGGFCGRTGGGRGTVSKGNCGDDDGDGGGDGGGGGADSVSVCDTMDIVGEEQESRRKKKESPSPSSVVSIIHIDDDEEPSPLPAPTSKNLPNSPKHKPSQTPSHPNPPPTKTTSPPSEQQPLLLCHRWIVASSTCRGGSTRYLEPVSITASSHYSSSSPNTSTHQERNHHHHQQNHKRSTPFSNPPSKPPRHATTNHRKREPKGTSLIRFRTPSLNGLLPPSLSSILAPLLRYRSPTSSSTPTPLPLIEIKSRALMEERGIGIGAEVPLEVEVWIVRWREFFGLFGGEGLARGWRVGRRGGGRVGGRGEVGSVREAAFLLLQWGKYGEEYGGWSGAARGCGEEGCVKEEDKEGMVNDLVGDGVTTQTHCNEDGSIAMIGGAPNPEDKERNPECSEEGGVKEGENEGMVNDLVGDNITTQTHCNEDGSITMIDSPNPEDKEQNPELTKFTNPKEPPNDDGNNESELFRLIQNVMPAEPNNIDLTTTTTAAIPPLEDLNDDAETLRENGVVLRPYQREAVRWMMRREGHRLPTTSTGGRCDDDNDTGDDDDEDLVRNLELLAELATSPSATTSSSDSILPPSSTNMKCELGPVLVSPETAHSALSLLSTTTTPSSYHRSTMVHHPLWERRYLSVSPSCQRSDDDHHHPEVYAIYVNELLRTASCTPPEPPRGCVGGILADAMGLGKTVMLLSLIARVKELEEEEEDGNMGDEREEEGSSTLVVAPLSLLAQWEEEIKEKTGLTCLAYYTDTEGVGGSRGRGSMVMNGFGRYDVVVTTYGMLQQEYLNHHRPDNNNNNISPNQTLPPLLSHQWKRIVLDEAHLVKNPTTYVAKACRDLHGRRRWCVTGTPIQNSLQDAYGLLSFLKHEPWCEMAFWRRVVMDEKISITAATTTTTMSGDGRKAIKEEKQEKDDDNDVMTTALDRVRRVLAPLMMRRTKETLSVDGKPILVLPNIDTRTIFVTLSDPERQFYDALLDRSIATFDGFLRSGTASKSWFAIFSLLQRLRQACNHVGLTINHRLAGGMARKRMSSGGDDDARKDYTRPSKIASTETIEEHEQEGEGKDGDYTMNRFLVKLLDTFQNHSATKNDSNFGDRSTTPTDRKNSLSTTSSYADRVAHSLSKTVSLNNNLEDECPICLERPECGNLAITPCAHVFCRTCLGDALIKSNGSNVRGSNGGGSTSVTQQKTNRYVDGECPVCMTWIDSSRILSVSNKSCEIISTTGATNITAEMAVTSGNKIELTPLTPKPIHAATSSSTTTTMELLEYALADSTSSKITAIIHELDEIWTVDPSSKIIIFSQFLGMLDLLQLPLSKRGIVSFRLDGSMSRKDRQVTLKNFNSHSRSENDASSNSSTAAAVKNKNSTEKIIQPPPQIIQRGTVLLASMKACGVGINLVSASSVILVDPWWNAATENQCIDRIHRIGQLAETVRVRKFIVSGTVEEQIVEMQRKKSAMAKRIVDRNGEGGGVEGGDSKPTMEDFRAVFARDDGG